MTKWLLIALALTLAGCGEQRPPAPTAEQNDQLNEAEAMLNEEAEDSNCPLPDEWDLAATLKPSPVPYTPKPVFYGEETRPGSWSWQGSSITYEAMLERVAVASGLNPRPVLLFNFAEGQSCSQLNARRAEIAEAAKCSANSVPCFEGTLADYHGARDEGS